MNIKQCLNLLVLSVAMLITGVSYSAVLSIDDSAVGDTGVDLGTFNFDIDATAFAIVTVGDPIDIPDEIFSLTSSGSFDSGSGIFSGTFNVGDPLSDTFLLSGSFSGLEVNSLGGADVEFFGDVIYTGGSLMGDLTGGRIEGTFSGASNLVATLGEVAAVPVPAAVWLFASGLLGLAGVARRKA